MATRSFIIIEDYGKFRGIYCHWDGYPEGNGAILLEHYDSVERLNALIDGGDLSTLGDLPENCEYYKDRGDKWENVKPATSDDLSKMIGIAEGADCEFIYLFEADDMQWNYVETNSYSVEMRDEDEIPFFNLLSEGLIQSVNE